MRNSVFFFLFSLFFSVAPSVASAQRSEVLSPTIASLQVIADDDWQALMPVTSLDDGKITVAFDELSHDYHRYSYSIQHCEADWTLSEELIESDFIDGFAVGNTIDDCAQSINTNVLYTHYKLQIPNDRCRLKISGNYLLTIYDEDNDDQPVAKVCFMVSENSMNVKLEVSTNTDIDLNNSHQQVSMALNFGSMRVTEPTTQIKTVVMQNGRWDNAVVNPRPQYVRADGLVWDHNRDLIFTAGNEYRKFETLDPTHSTMGLERVGWDGKQYHAWVWTDEPRPNYIYDEDANGAFCIRNSDNIGNDTESDYILTHFRLKSPRQNGDIYLNGAWTQDRFDERYKMKWSDDHYEAIVPLKQGYYNYQYLLMTPDGVLRPVPSEGSFYQTENEYQALVYYRQQGGRTDRLVAVSPYPHASDY